MPEYVYRSGDGVETSLILTMSDDHPETVEENGTVYRRVYGNCQINGNPVSARYPVASTSLPRNLPGWEKHSGYHQGKPIVRHKQDADRIEKQYGYEKD